MTYKFGRFPLRTFLSTIYKRKTNGLGINLEIINKTIQKVKNCKKIQKFFSMFLCLAPRKFEGKCKGKKIQRKSRRKEKIKENKKQIKNR